MREMSDHCEGKFHIRDTARPGIPTQQDMNVWISCMSQTFHPDAAMPARANVPPTRPTFPIRYIEVPEQDLKCFSYPTRWTRIEAYLARVWEAIKGCKDEPPNEEEDYD